MIAADPIDLRMVDYALSRAEEIFEMYMEIEQNDADYMDFWRNDSRLGGIARREVESARSVLAAMGIRR